MQFSVASFAKPETVRRRLFAGFAWHTSVKNGVEDLAAGVREGQ